MFQRILHIVGIINQSQFIGNQRIFDQKVTEVVLQIFFKNENKIYRGSCGMRFNNLKLNCDPVINDKTKPIIISAFTFNHN